MTIERKTRESMDVLKETLKEAAALAAFDQEPEEAARTKKAYASSEDLIEIICEFSKQWDKLMEQQLTILNNQRDIMDMLRHHRHTPTGDEQGT